MKRVTRKDCVAYKDQLVDAVLDEDIKSHTASNQLKRLKTIFSHTYGNDKIESDPFDRVKLDIAVESGEREDFTSNECRKALAAALVETNPMLRWFQWLGYYTGCRDSELMRAHKDSVQEIEGVWCLCIPKRYGLKTKNSERTIPLHPEVIEEGFLTYVASLPDGSRLFPDYSESDIFKDLAAFYDGLGITKRFYSLRHTLHTHYRYLEGVDPDVTRYLLAHGKAGAHARYGRNPADKLLPVVVTIPNPLRNPEIVKGAQGNVGLVPT